MHARTMAVRLALVGLCAGTGAGPATAQESGGFLNLQVLPQDISRDELKATMEGFADELDVKCTFCHMPDEYELDDKNHKVIARRMLKLVLMMRENSAEYFKDDTPDDRIDCWSCHRGKADPEQFRPAE